MSSLSLNIGVFQNKNKLRSYAFLANDMGLINKLIKHFGGKQISFYNSPKYWPFILTAFYLWKSIGFDTLVHYGTILSIDSELFEASSHRSFAKVFA